MAVAGGIIRLSSDSNCSRDSFSRIQRTGALEPETIWPKSEPQRPDQAGFGASVQPFNVYCSYARKDSRGNANRDENPKHRAASVFYRP
jgi:hypothetical protein